MRKRKVKVFDRLFLQRGPAEERRCILIAEAGVNHDGRIGRAIELVEVAAEGGERHEVSSGPRREPRESVSSQSRVFGARYWAGSSR